MISSVGPAGMGPSTTSGIEDSEARLHSDKEVVSRLVALLAPYKQRLFWSFVLMVFASGATLAQPWIIKQSIDRGILGGRLNELYLWGAAYVVSLSCSG